MSEVNSIPKINNMHLTQKSKININLLKDRIKSIWKKTMPYMFVTPALIILTIFVVFPIGYMIYLSFFSWNLIGPKTFAYLDNYKIIFSDSTFWQVFFNSWKYTFMYVFFTLLFSLPLAFYLKGNTKTNKIMQSVIFTPHIISLVSVTFIWIWLLDADYGLLNYATSFIGIKSIRWLGDKNFAMWSVVLVAVWKGLGYNTIILISAMQTIPKYLYEASSLDNAKPFKVFYRITIPMISPTIFFLTLMNLIGAFKVFETISIMTEGGPSNATNTLVYDIYRYAFDYYKIGEASSIGVVLMVIIAICTILYFKLMSKRVHYR